MPTVAIPASHFIKSVPKNYSYYKKAFIREYLQNSVDAGAKLVDFQFDGERTLTVTDDGCGMSRDLLVSALLTLSGSKKGDNSIGGFGAAKELIIFSMESYEITTTYNGVTTKVVGAQLEYEFEEVENQPRDGTSFKVVFHEDLNIENFESIAWEYLSECQTNADIYWNGVKVECKIERGDLIRELEWCKIYAEELEYNTNYAEVRINGVNMFSAFVDDTKFKVVIEVTKPSIDILTVNRDCFQYHYSSKLQRIINEISIEKGQFGAVYNKNLVWRGKNNSYSCINFDFENLLENKDNKFGEYVDKIRKLSLKARETAKMAEADNPDVSVSEVVDRVREVINDEALKESIPYDLIDRMIERSTDLVCNHKADFYVKATGKGFDKIPDNLSPGNWSKRTTSLAKLWKHCLKIVMRCNAMPIEYSIGWVLDYDEKSVALYQRENGVSIFYINPLLTWMRSSNHAHVFNKMILIACHEVTHYSNSSHNEYFQSNYEDMLHRVLCYLNKSGNSWWKCYLASKNEVI
jgi:hypothetical protein